MDCRSWNTDRTDPLRSLPSAPARGTFQVLQPPLQHVPRGVDGTVAPSVGGSGRAHGSERAIGAECEHCGGPLPDGSSANRMYCSKACKQAAYVGRDRAERIAARKGRTCLWCCGPIAPEVRGDVIYCSKICQTHSQIDMQKARRSCQHCGKSFRGFGKFCSHACYGKSKRTLHPKECPVCQATFKPHRAEQVCCSRACAAPARRQLADIACGCCGDLFRPRHAATRFCSRSCATRARQ